MSPKEHEELKTQVDDLLDKGLVQESESSYVVPTMLVLKKIDLGECVLLGKLSTTFDSRGSKIQHRAKSGAI